MSHRSAKTKSAWILWSLFALSACSSRYSVRTYPEGAKVQVQNVVSKESFEIGESPVEFEHLSKFGDGFVVKVEKESFEPKEVFVTRTPGSKAEYQVNLRPLSEAEVAKEDEEKKQEAKQQTEDEMKKRLAVLERAFEIYKDALFSERYGSSPASYDRRKIDLSIGLVAKAQQLIEEKKFDEASAIVDKLLEKDEYLSQAHVLKGTIAYLKQDWPAATRSWERALEINPYDKLTRQYLVDVYQKSGREVPGDPDEIEMVDRMPASSPLSPDPLNLRLKNR